MCKGEKIKNEVCWDSEVQDTNRTWPGNSWASLGSARLLATEVIEVIEWWLKKSIDFRNRETWTQISVLLFTTMCNHVWPRASESAFLRFSSSFVIQEQWYHRFVIMIKWDKECREFHGGLINAKSPPLHHLFLCPASSLVIMKQTPGNCEGCGLVGRKLPTVWPETSFHTSQINFRPHPQRAENSGLFFLLC